MRGEAGKVVNREDKYDAAGGFVNSGRPTLSLVAAEYQRPVPNSM